MLAVRTGSLGQPRGQPRARRPRSPGAHAVVGAEHHRLRLDGLHAGRIGAAEGEDGLIGIARQQHGARAAPEHAHQLHLLRVEVLRVVDDEVAHPLALGREQLGIGRERVERGRHQLGRVERGRRGLRRSPPRRAPQQRDLLVAAEEPPRRGPLGNLVPRPQLGQLVRTEPPLGGAQQQLAQLGGEARHRQRRPIRSGQPDPGTTPSTSPPNRSRTNASCSALASSRGGGSPLPGGVQAEHAERVGVHRADQRLTAGRPIARAQAYQPLPQLRGRPPAPDQHERARGILARRQPLARPR